MTQTYAQIQKQIESLQQKADALRQRELKGVVDRIKVAIAHYGLTPDQLFAATKGAAKASTTQPSTGASAPKFSDDKGNTWAGRGPRPRWLRDAIEAGAQVDDFKDVARSAAPATKVKAKKLKAKRAPSKVVYSDGAGRQWTGRGPKPGWVKEALAAGKELKDLAQ